MYVTIIPCVCALDVEICILLYIATLYRCLFLVYSHAGDNDVAHQIIYTGFINELVNVLELPDEFLIVSV